MNRPAKRVARLYLIKLAEEKSLNLQIDEKFKTWKGTNPLTKNEVGYWTVKGWKQLSKKQVSEDKDKAKLQEYAIEVFKAFEEEITGKKTKKKKKKKKKQTSQEKMQKEIQQSIKDMGTRPNFGLPDSVFKDNKMSIEIDTPSKEDVSKLAEDIKELFATPGYQRGALAQNVAAFGSDEYLKRTTKMVAAAAGPVVGVLASSVAKVAGAAGFDWGKNTDEAIKAYKQDLKENRESNPEVRRMQKNLATFWTQSMFSIGAGAATTTGVTATLGTAVATSLAAAGGGAVALAAAPALSLGIGAMSYKFLLHNRSGKVGQAKSWAKKKVKKMVGKEDDLPESYDNLAADIYAGYATPEGVEAEYKKKLDTILNDDSLDPTDARQKMLELYEDFDTNARPSIDKGLLLLGVADRGKGAGDSDISKLFDGVDFDMKDPKSWAGALSQVADKVKGLNRDDLAFLKMGSGINDLSFLKIYETPPHHLRLAADANPTPIIQQIMQYKDMFDSQEQFADAIEANPEEFGKELQRVLAGDEEIPQEVQDFYKGDLGKEYDSEDDEGSKKKAHIMAKRVARLYMRSSL